MAWVVIAALGLVLSTAATAQTTKCPGGPPGWKAAEGTGCKIWNHCPQNNETVTWSGSCVNGMADGIGTTVWSRDEKQTQSYEGGVKAGKSEGQGIVRTEKQTVQGEWREGKLNGQVVIVSDKSRYEGGVSQGKPHGYGVLTMASGTVYKGNWTNGCLKINAKGDMIALGATAAECGGTRR